MEGKRYLTSEEIMKEAEALGIPLVERKLKYYVTLGLLEKPARNPRNAGMELDGRVAYFSVGTLERLRKIKELQDSGFTLPQIKKYFENELKPALTEFLEGKGHAAVPADTVAKAFLGDGMREAFRKFQARIRDEGGEEAFQEAAFSYYEDILSQLLGRKNAAKYVKDFLRSASPAEREKKLEPLRRWKEGLAGAQKAGKSPFSKVLEQMCSSLEKGDFRAGDIMEKLQELAEKIQALQEKYRERTRLFSEAFEISKFMRSIFWAYLKALLEIEAFVKNGEVRHIEKARLLFSKADLMLSSVEDLVARVKELVSLADEVGKL
ncbi:MAG: MerR family transcriptional regulator [Candidatus Eremiobacteraeota bacterium]|nr:MerR family transcriptional regulator [Candidatus Eremiobacteraeota bacterium]